MTHLSYWQTIWQRFKKRPWGVFGLVVLLLFILSALFAPFLASSMPICVLYDGEFFFPLFRYLVSSSFFTKKLDLFFNLLSLLCIPFLITFLFRGKKRFVLQIMLIVAFIVAFVTFGFYCVVDPALSQELNVLKQKAFLELSGSQGSSLKKRAREELPSWEFDLRYMNQYARLNLIIHQKNMEMQHARIVKALRIQGQQNIPYTVLQIHKEQEEQTISGLKKAIQKGKRPYIITLEQERKIRKELQSCSDFKASSQSELERHLQELENENEAYEALENRLRYIFDKQGWIENQKKKITFICMPLLTTFHWEDDAGGEQALNLHVPFYELTRTTRKDLVAALIFGSRISLFVGFVSTLLSLAIGVILGLISGYYGGKTDIVLSRFVEVWESLPAFFILLFVVTIMETKSIFLIIAVIALFSWTQGLRFVRAEVFRQRELAYVDATRALGFSDARILFSHILPNALLAVLALLPFDIMAAITREAGLAFLGLGEEQSCSWGVLMDEGRLAFPAESSLLWPPAIVLTLLLVAIAFVGEALQWAMNPKAAGKG